LRQISIIVFVNYCIKHEIHIFNGLLLCKSNLKLQKILWIYVRSFVNSHPGAFNFVSTIYSKLKARNVESQTQTSGETWSSFDLFVLMKGEKVNFRNLFLKFNPTLKLFPEPILSKGILTFKKSKLVLKSLTVSFSSI